MSDRILVLILSTALITQSCATYNEKRVKPGINDSWKGSDVSRLTDRLEGESREIYTNRQELAELVGPKPGSAVADIGAGSGFMALLFAEKTGPEGKVYAVDINPHMMKMVAERAAAAGLTNVETLACAEDDTNLPANSVDLVFICDTYHHFEYPESTMASIHRALRDGGELVLVDFERIPGKSPQWLLNHVRAGKEVFTQEILDAGFERVTEHRTDFLKENYVVRFRKK